MDQTTIHVGYQSLRAEVWSVYEARDLIKSIPGRLWEPEDRLWTIPAIHAELLAKKLRKAGFPCVIERAPAPALRGGNGHKTWAHELLLPLSETRRRLVYHALVKILHPDVGGDVELMKTLNNAHEDLGGD